MAQLHTYTVISKDFSTVINHLTWEQGKELACKMDAHLLTVKDNYVTAIREFERVDYNGVDDFEQVHLEKHLINTPLSHV